MPRVGDALPIFLTLVMHHHYYSPLAGNASFVFDELILVSFYSDAQPYMFKSVMHHSQSPFFQRL